MSISKSLYPYLYFTAFTFILMLVDASLEHSLITAYISFGIMIYYLLKIYGLEPDFFLLNILIIVGYAQAVFSNITIESFKLYNDNGYLIIKKYLSNF